MEAKFTKKNVQVLDSFVEALDKLKHGGLKETVNAALLMFFMANFDRKRFARRLYREIAEGEFTVIPRPTGHGAALIHGGLEVIERGKELNEKLFGLPAAYFDEGSISDLPDDLDGEKYPEHLRPKKKTVVLGEKNGPSAVVVAAKNQRGRKPKTPQRRKGV